MSALRGDVSVAMADYIEALGIGQRWAAANPSDIRWQRDLPASHDAIGNVQWQQGNLASALASYETSFAFAQCVSQH
jgi:hypothetical protein